MDLNLGSKSNLGERFGIPNFPFFGVQKFIGFEVQLVAQIQRQLGERLVSQVTNLIPEHHASRIHHAQRMQYLFTKVESTSKSE